jgi:hypothetical protein
MFAGRALPALRYSQQLRREGVCPYTSRPYRIKFLIKNALIDLARRFMRRSLDRNPFIWLEYDNGLRPRRADGDRLCACRSETAIFMEIPRRTEFVGMHFLIFRIGGFHDFKVVQHFQRAKECGAFEVLLVTPLTEAEMVWGETAGCGRLLRPDGGVSRADWSITGTTESGADEEL